MRHRFVLSLVAMFLMMSLGIMTGYQIRSGEAGMAGPAQLSSYVMIESLPAWTVLNITCSGSGTLVVKDEIKGSTIFTHEIRGQLTAPVVIPHEGTYSIQVVNGSAMCSTFYHGIHPTERVQNVYYILGGLSAFILAFLIWRWWK